MHRDTMTSHAFALNLKRYAAVVGIARIHLHQTLHTFARMVSDDMGSPGRVLVGGGQFRAPSRQLRRGRACRRNCFPHEPFETGPTATDSQFKDDTP